MPRLVRDHLDRGGSLAAPRAAGCAIPFATCRPDPSPCPPTTRRWPPPASTSSRCAGPTSRASGAISAEAMTGLDRKAQALGVTGRAADGARRHGRRRRGPGAARAQRPPRPARADPRRDRATTAATGSSRRASSRGGGSPSIAVLVGGEREAGHRATRRATGSGSTASPSSRRSTPRSRATSHMLGQGIDKAGVVVDALLGTGVRGRLREPDPRGGRASSTAPARWASPSSRSTRRPRSTSPVGRPERPGRPRRPHRHLPPPQDRPPRPRRQGARRPDPRRPDRHPARGGPCLTSASPGSARSLLLAAAVVADRARGGGRHRPAPDARARASCSTPRC